jgi:hypothetical protein
MLFESLEWLFKPFTSAGVSPEGRRVLLECLNKDTLNEWNISIPALPPLRDTHHLPFLLMLLVAYDTFSEVGA